MQNSPKISGVATTDLGFLQRDWRLENFLQKAINVNEAWGIGWELGTGQGSYAVALLVSPLVTLMIAKFVGLSESCFVEAFFFPALYV